VSATGDRRQATQGNRSLASAMAGDEAGGDSVMNRLEPFTGRRALNFGLALRPDARGPAAVRMLPTRSSGATAINRVVIARVRAGFRNAREGEFLIIDGRVERLTNAGTCRWAAKAAASTSIGRMGADGEARISKLIWIGVRMSETRYWIADAERYRDRSPRIRPASASHRASVATSQGRRPSRWRSFFRACGRYLPGGRKMWLGI
jgi:hypothetical protein